MFTFISQNFDFNAEELLGATSSNDRDVRCEEEELHFWRNLLDLIGQ